MTDKQKIKKAFELLERIPVAGPLVDTMHTVRTLLAEVHNGMGEAVSEEAKNDG